MHYDEEDLPWQLAWSESIERDEVDYLLDYLRSSGVGRQARWDVIPPHLG